MEYRKDIDGIRAISVLAVIIFHLNENVLPGGFFGVDIFFVLSGFLITSIIVHESENKIFSLKRFWSRRIKRILPAVTILIFTFLLCGYFLLDDDSLKLLGKQSFYSNIFSANIFFMRMASDYWAPNSKSLPLLHLWSLGVEEQFYLVYPILLSFLFYKKQNISLYLAGIGIVSFVLFIYFSRTNAPVAFYSAPTRAWELIAGALSSSIFKNLKYGFNRLIGLIITWLALLIIIVSFFIYSDDLFSTYAIIVTAATAILLIFNKKEFLTNRILSSKPLVYIGKLSYSFYLWHWPVIVFVKVLGYPYWLILLFLPFSILSYHYIENPLRKKGSVSTIIILWVFVSMLSVAFGKSKIKALQKFSFEAPLKSTQYDCQKYIKSGGIIINPEKKQEVLVLGNSMAYQNGESIIKSFSDYKIVFLTVGGTPSRFLLPGEDGTDRQPPVLWTHNERLEFDSIRRMEISKHPAFIIVSERWNFENKDELYRIDFFLEYLAENASHLIVTTETPVLDIQNEIPFQRICENLLRKGANRIKQEESSIKRRENSNEILYSFKNKIENMYIINLDSIFLNQEGILFRDNKNILYSDKYHLSINGSFLIEPYFKEIKKK